MVKSVKAIILASVMVSMSVMLINSCGVSSPTSSTGNTGAQVAPLPAALTLNTASKSPLPPVLADPAISTLPAASIADLLKAPHANPNASGAPFKFTCGDYSKIALAKFDSLNNATYLFPFFPKSYLSSPQFAIDYPTPPFGLFGVVVGKWYFNNGGYNEGFTMDCAVFPNGINLPWDFFTGSGFPDGIYIIGGMMYEKGTDPVTGTPTVKPPVPAPVDPATGKPYNDGYYPPAGGTNPPATTPPGNNNPPTGGTNPPPAGGGGGATLASLTVYTTTPTVSAGTKAQFNVIGVMSDGSTSPLTNTSVIWQSDNTPVATINGSGLATTLIEGTANITATYNGLTSNPIPLTVNPPELTKITISPTNASTSVFDVAGFTAYGSFSNNVGRDMTNEVSWSSGGGTIVSPLEQYVATYTTLASVYYVPLHDLGHKYYIGLKNGTATISAASGGISGVADIMVGCRSYTYYSQISSVWKDNLYAKYYYTDTWPTPIVYGDIHRNTIGHKGCALSCTAMLLASKGFKNTSGNLYTPSSLNTKYNEGYDSLTFISLGFDDGGVIWDAIDNVSNNKIANWVNISIDWPFTTALQMNLLDPYLVNCYAVIAGVRGHSTNSSNNPEATHYVLVTGKNGNTYDIKDPEHPEITTLDQYGAMYEIHAYQIND